MARESCNLDNKDEAEILTPSPPSPNPAPPPVGGGAALFVKPPQAAAAVAAQDLPPPANGMAAEPAVAAPAAEGASGEKEEARQAPVRRCSSCRKRVGLTAFRCRCGDLFCGRHRYSDTHDCSFDYKAAGREEISKNNPVIRAAKIIKI